MDGQCEQLGQELSTALTQARNLAHELYSVSPTPEGLVEALENLAERVATDRGVSCAFVSEPTVLINNPTGASHLYVMKAEGPERLAAAIRMVLHGEVALSPRMSAKDLESMVGPAGNVEAGPEAKLTDRELEVLRLFGEGWNTDEIARRLCLSPKTVDVHRAHIKESSV